MSRHRNMKYIAEDAINSMDYEEDYDDYYEAEDPAVFGKQAIKENLIANQIPKSNKFMRLWETT